MKKNVEHSKSLINIFYKADEIISAQQTVIIYERSGGDIFWSLRFWRFSSEKLWIEQIILFEKNCM